MKPNIIHSIIVCLTALSLPFMAACGSSQDEPVPMPEPEGTGAALYLNIETIGQTKTIPAEFPDNEKMHGIRIVVLHQNGTVEHNRYYALDGPQAQHAILLPVISSETKTIFLIANEESVTAIKGATSGDDKSLTAFLDSYHAGDAGFAQDIDDIFFAPDYTGGKPIPMSAMYKVDVPQQGLVEKSLYVVRVATKFMLNFMNWRGEEVTVDNFTIASHADLNFLMAHVGSYPHSDTYPTWIDWLKTVSDESSENDDYATTDAAGWLTDYDLPAQADRTKIYTHTSAITVGTPTVDLNNPENSKPGIATTIPVFYLPESMNPKDGNIAHGEQEYTLTVGIRGVANPFVCTLPNLKSLFRNTHVVVDITFYNSNEIIVDVIPYSEIELDPIFGV